MLKLIQNQEQLKILSRNKTWQYLHVTLQKRENKRRTHYKLTAPSVKFDETTGDYSRSHRVSLKGYYKGRKIAKAAK